jgi:hypothetical protein
VEDFLVSFLGLDSTLRDLFIFFFFPLASSWSELLSLDLLLLEECFLGFVAEKEEG